MFGRSKESLDYTVRPTDEGREILAQQALERIETIDGIDYLDGHKLPPDNEEIFGDARPRTIHITHLYHRVNERGKDEYQAIEKTHIYEPTFTNKDARAANIRFIASGGSPLFVLWEDVNLEALRQPRNIYWQKAKKAAGNLLDRMTA